MQAQAVRGGTLRRVTFRFALLIATLVLAMGLAFAAIPQQAQAATEHTSGSYTYTVSSGVATITGYSGSATTLTVPDTLGDYTVMYIDDEAFANCTTITSVTFPTTLQTIESSAFEGCTKLASVTLPKNLSSLGSYAFANCTKLSTLTVNSASLSCNWRGAFQNAGIAGSGISVTFGSDCKAVPDQFLHTDDSSEAPYVTSISMSSSIESIGDDAFDNLTGLTSVVVGSAVTSIGESAFSGCTYLASVTFPTTLQTIESSAFEGCTKLASVTLPKNLSSLGSYAFTNCTKLSTLTVNSASLSCNWRGAFQNAGIAGSGISVSFGSKCTTIPEDLLKTDDSSEAPNVTKITVPYTVTSIGDDAFGSVTGYTLAGYKGSVGWTYYKANKSDDDITWKKLGTVMSFCSVKLSTTSYVYSGKARAPGVTVKDGSTALKKSTHFTVTYAKGRKSIGTYKVTVKGVNSAGYYGSVTKTFKIVPGKVTLKKAKGGTNKFTVKWAKRAGGVKKYQVAYRSTGSSSWTYVTVSAKKSSCTVKFSYWHSSSYQVKVRAVTGSCKGAWSKVRKVKVK